VRRSLSANDLNHTPLPTTDGPSAVFFTYGVHPADGLGIIEMLRSCLVALLRSNELHPCLTLSDMCDHRKEDLEAL